MQQDIVKNLLKTFDQAGLWEDGKERGFTINLPNPRDYCLHKLIMGQRRKHAAKRLKDIEHAVYVLPILNSDDVAHPVAAYPPKWRKLIKDSLRQAVAQIPEEIPTINLNFSVGPGIRRRISHFFVPQKVRPMSLHRPHLFRPKK